MELPAYKKHKDHDEIIRSAYTAVKAILSLELYPAHKRELLDICIWKISEVDGKYKTRYRSIGALQEMDVRNLRHEHVEERKELIYRLIEDPDNYESILNDIVACIVTKEEHEQLHRQNKKGWDRYKAAKIKVFDLINRSEFPL